MDKKVFVVVFLACWGAVCPQLLFAENVSVDIGAFVPDNGVGGSTSSSGGGGGGGGGSLVVSNPIVSLSGTASAKNIITLLKDGQAIATATAAIDGSFQFNVSNISAGNYTFGLYATNANGKRSVLLTLPVLVAASGVTAISGIVVAEPTLGFGQTKQQDINSDGKVNLIDFSIAAYWYGKPSPPANVDFNADGKVNLIDFSIMAFYWTG